MYRKILVGTDGSATAAKAVERAVEVARLTGATLTIMTAARRGPRAQQVVDEAAARHAGEGVEIETLVVESDPATALVETAEAGGFDLLVTGNKGMTGARRLLGSVPNKVGHQLPTNFLIVRTT